jgi:hypothetical protein
MSDEARETAAWAEYAEGAQWGPRDRLAARDNFAHGFDAGVAEGIRKAREAVAGRLADPAVSTSPVVLGVVDSLAAIDALAEGKADHE